MTTPDSSPTPSPSGPEEAETPATWLEAARSSRSRCRTCRRKIDKDVLRLGVLLEGPYGTGYLWHHLNCAAKRRFEDVEDAYRERTWDPELEVPPLDELSRLREKAEEKKAQRKETPYVERAPTGRSKCRHCEELIEKGSLRVALAREVTFGNQVRATAVNVHPRCVAAELRAEDCVTEVDGFEDALRRNSDGMAEEDVAESLEAIGALE